MSLYLLLIVPALMAALWRERLSTQTLAWIWFSMSLLMVWLIPLGSRDYVTYLRDFSDFNEMDFAQAVRQDPLYASAVWLFGHLGGSAEVFYPLLASLGLGHFVIHNSRHNSIQEKVEGKRWAGQRLNLKR